MCDISGNVVLVFKTVFATGNVFSLFLFKRRAWPLIFGTGSGFGMGYANCQKELQSAFKVQEKK